MPEKFLKLVCLLCLLVALPVAAQAPDEPSPPNSLQPVSISQAVCELECIQQTIELTFPNRAQPDPLTLDLFIVMDITGSMDDELSTVKESSVLIAEQVNTLVPDWRIGFGTYSDYGSIPWRLDADFTNNIVQLQNNLNRISIDAGGQEPGWRALDEISQLSWRSEAIKIIILFGDEVFLDPDPGRDGNYGNEDDINPDAVLSSLRGQNIRIIAINTGGGNDVRNLYRTLAEETLGDYLNLNNARDIPRLITDSVGATLRDFQYNFQVENISGQAGAVLPESWITLSPDYFPYPENDTSVFVEVSFCPNRAELPTEDYTLDLVLKNQDFLLATIPVSIPYSSICQDAIIPDVVGDRGQCNDEKNQIWWDSAGIVVRNQQDEIRESQRPLVGQPNYVYVQLYNIGQRDLANATLTVYSSQTLLDNNFPGDWIPFASTEITIPPKQEVWAGPFEWQALSDQVILRAEIDSLDDPITLPNDVACDNNIAQVNSLYIDLSEPSVQKGRVRGEIPFVIFNPTNLNFETLDLAFVSENMGGEALLSLNLDSSTRQLLGGEGSFQTNLSRPLVLENVLGGNRTQLMGELAIQSDINARGSLNVLVQDSSGKTVSGGQLRYETAPGLLPLALVSAPSTASKYPAGLPSSVIPLALSALVLLLIALVWFLRR